MRKTFKKLLVSCILLFCIVLISGCNKKSNKQISSSSLIGSWEHSSYTYTFNNDKTGTYDSNGTVMKFTYEDNGSQVSILYEGNTSANDFAYKIEGKKLIIKDSFGNDVEYTKK